MCAYAGYTHYWTWHEKPSDTDLKACIGEMRAGEWWSGLTTLWILVLWALLAVAVVLWFKKMRRAM
jgi:hypothetical protein